VLYDFAREQFNIILRHHVTLHFTSWGVIGPKTKSSNIMPRRGPSIRTLQIFNVMSSEWNFDHPHIDK
jgi:hypothetical protein